MHCRSISDDSLRLTIYFFLYRYAIWYFWHYFLAWVQCFYVLGFIWVMNWFIILIRGILRTNGTFWHGFVRYIFKFSCSSLGKIWVIWKDEGLRGAWQSHQKYQHNESPCAGSVVKRGLESREISWNLRCLYLSSQRGELDVGAPKIMSAQFKFVGKDRAW